MESLVTGIVDMWPDYLRPRRRQFTTGICILLFLLGTPMVTNGGAYVFQVRIKTTLLNNDVIMIGIVHLFALWMPSIGRKLGIPFKVILLQAQ